METLTLGIKQLLGFEPTPPQVEAFRVYADELAVWNSKFNLTAIREPRAIEIKHFLDSATCLLAMRPLTTRPAVIDIGTGAGFPGVPLKLLCPDLRLTLVESVGKKVAFLEHIVSKLDLKDVRVIKSRAEELGQDKSHREKYDWAIARAVAAMPVLLEYLLPLVRRGGKALAQKGDNAPAETHDPSAERAAKILGGSLAQLMEVELPTVVEPRYLVVFEKVAASPSRYPRRPGVPAKEPLGV